MCSVEEIPHEVSSFFLGTAVQLDDHSQTALCSVIKFFLVEFEHQ